MRPIPDLPTRDDLDARILEVLHRGGPANPDVLLVESEHGPIVVKDFAPRGAMARLVGRLLTRRELCAYRQLDGHPNVPRLLGQVDALGFCVEYRPGERLSRALRGKLPPGFTADLRDAVERMHARGVVHLDLRHRSNVLASPDGRPVLIDFASAICLRPRGLAARLLLPLLARLDRRALRKWELRLEA